MDDTKVRSFEKFLLSLEGQVIQGRIFENCMNLRFDKQGVNVTRNAVLQEEFTTCLKMIFQNIESRIGELNEINQRHQFVGLLGLYTLYFNIYRYEDFCPSYAWVS